MDFFLILHDRRTQGRAVFGVCAAGRKAAGWRCAGAVQVLLRAACAVHCAGTAAQGRRGRRAAGGSRNQEGRRAAAWVSGARGKGENLAKRMSHRP